MLGVGNVVTMEYNIIYCVSWKKTRNYIRNYKPTKSITEKIIIYWIGSQPGCKKQSTVKYKRNKTKKQKTKTLRRKQNKKPLNKSWKFKKRRKKSSKKWPRYQSRKKLKLLSFKKLFIVLCWQKSSRSSLSASAINSGFAS